MKYQRALALSLVVVGAAGLATLAEALGGLTGVRDLRHRALDWRQATTRESFQLDRADRESDIVLVFFDELAVTDPEMGWPWEQPFPRSHIAKVVDAVAGAGARTIGLDVFLELREPQLNALDQGDDLLRAALARAGNVILVGPVDQRPDGPVLGRPDPFFEEVAADVGAAELPTSFETVREAALAVRSGAGLEPSFALALYAHFRGMDVDSLLLQARRWDRIPLAGLPAGLGEVPSEWWERGTSHADFIVPFTLRYSGPPSSADGFAPPGTFPAVSSSTVDLTAMLQPELFQDKIVLIGTGFHDYDKFRTPYFDAEVDELRDDGDSRRYGYMYGVEVHANALQNMLDGSYVRPLSAGAQILLLLGAAALTGGVAFRFGPWAGAGATLVTILGLLAVGFWTWAGQVYGPGGTWLTLSERFLWFPVVTPSLSALFAYVGSVGYVSVVEGREKRFIKGAFGKYVSPEVVAEIAENPEALQLGGQKRPMTLLFSDLAGFTTLSERMDPQDLLAKLNEYLSEMTQVVLDQGGTLDKYIGDAIMAFWNAPKATEDHAERALRCAVLMQRKMNELNARWRQQDPDAEELVVRIGVNSGTVVVGNVGGKDRFDYSAIGDAVNLAARLEPANKSYDTLTMASEFTMAEVEGNRFRHRELDLIAVKGKERPVIVYEILEEAGVELPEHREQCLRHYHEGLSAYKEREWTRAASCFREALQADPSDGPSRVYLERAEEYSVNPPPVEWDFVVRRTSK